MKFQNAPDLWKKTCGTIVCAILQMWPVIICMREIPKCGPLCTWNCEKWSFWFVKFQNVDPFLYEFSKGCSLCIQFLKRALMWTFLELCHKKMWTFNRTLNIPGEHNQTCTFWDSFFKCGLFVNKIPNYTCVELYQKNKKYRNVCMAIPICGPCILM